MAELDEYEKAVKAEWGVWVAKTDIHFGTALAYREGDPVPSSNVAEYGYDKQGLVEKTASTTSTSAKG